MSSEALFRRIDEYHCCSHSACVKQLYQQIQKAQLSTEQLEEIENRAYRFCQAPQSASSASEPLQQLMQEYSLSSREGLALMILIEALSRIEDPRVAAQLMEDCLQGLNWQEHLGSHKSGFVNMSTLLLLLTGKLLDSTEHQAEKKLRRLLRKLSAPMIERSLRAVIHHIAKQFIYASDVDSAITQGCQLPGHQTLFSLDMLGEEALTTKRAKRYLQRYNNAAQKIVDSSQQHRFGLSIKLSALLPRYEPTLFNEAKDALVQHLAPLMELARNQQLPLMIDAEESHRLELGLSIVCALLERCDPGEQSPLGLAVQAYSPRALPVLEYLQALAAERRIRVPVRLVKGAYWDSEIKLAQLQGLPEFPVFIDKHHTDLSYLACAQYLLQNEDQFVPAFATHNALCISHIISLAPKGHRIEFQRLHGMGSALYEEVCRNHPNVSVRVYGPVGDERELLPYLIRRLLENAANNSFVKRLLSDKDLKPLCRHPLRDVPTENNAEKVIKKPANLYEPDRANSPGLNLVSQRVQNHLKLSLQALQHRVWEWHELSGQSHQGATKHCVLNPYDGSPVGHSPIHQASELHAMVESCMHHWHKWRNTPVEDRAACLERFACLLDTHRVTLLSLLIREAGKTIPDALGEIREAIDFANYYARQARHYFSAHHRLPGAIGEENSWRWVSRGPFLCISPWNFPLAIFCGQVCAALVCGNPVIAKPASYTPLIAGFAVKLLKQAGIPDAVIHLALIPGHELESGISEDKHLRGIAFTGSDTSAARVHRALAARSGPRLPLIAETGGQNVMIADCSSLQEQLCKDIVQSAFMSAGQRCSCLRILCVQQEIKDELLELLTGYLNEMRLGNPADLRTDIGPLIHHEAKASLLAHCEVYELQQRVLFEGTLDDDARQDNLLAPRILEVAGIEELKQEQFGPILHLASFDYGQSEQLADSINRAGFGLTCGIHSRNTAWAKRMAEQINVGNVYINRNMVGAIVGAQPFGGMGRSGTGPKAGGPHYLSAFATEQAFSHNSAALGGSVDVLAGPSE